MKIRWPLILGICGVLFWKLQSYSKETPKVQGDEPMQKPKMPMAKGTFESSPKVGTPDQNLFQARSLEGVSVPRLTVLDGSLVPNTDLLFFMEYFLSSKGELNDEEIYQNLRIYLEQHYPTGVKEKVLEIWDLYNSYRQDHQDFVRSLQEGGTVSDWEVLEAIVEHRRNYFPDGVGEGMFEEDNHYDLYTAERLKIKSLDLPEEEKRSLTQQLDQDLSPAIQKFRSEALAPINLADRIQELKRAGYSKDAIHMSRVEMVGRKAADRLNHLDQERENYRRLFQESLRQLEDLDTGEAAQLIPKLVKRFPEKQQRRASIMLENELKR